MHRSDSPVQSHLAKKVGTVSGMNHKMLGLGRKARDVFVLPDRSGRHSNKSGCTLALDTQCHWSVRPVQTKGCGGCWSLMERVFTQLQGWKMKRVV